jgi:hypothetical protein
MEEKQKARSSTKMWFIVAVGALALLAVLAGRVFSGQGWGRYLLLMQHGSTGEATVVATLGRDNCLLEYSFSVARRSYRGTGPECRASVGQKVTVTYLVSDPSQSCLGPAGERLANEVVSYFFGGLSFPPL